VLNVLDMAVARRERKAYPAIEPECHWRPWVAIPSRKKPEPFASVTLVKQVSAIETHQMLLSEAISPHPEVRYTPGVVSNCHGNTVNGPLGSSLSMTPGSDRGARRRLDPLGHIGSSLGDAAVRTPNDENLAMTLYLDHRDGSQDGKKHGREKHSELEYYRIPHNDFMLRYLFSQLRRQLRRMM